MSDRPHLEDVPFGAATVLFGEQGGKYPSGNSVLVEGREESLVIDPSLGLVSRRSGGRPLPRVDRVVNSHCHEDHIAGNHLFPDVPWHLHADDLPGIRSLDGMMAIYGFDETVDRVFRDVVVKQFHFTPRPDAVAYADGHVFDLGGATATAIHSPGHTRGHTCFLVEASGADPLLYLGDIDLSSFGPYYGDAWSDLGAFETTLDRVREIESRWYATFHHIGVLERDAFQEKLARFRGVIADRERRLLEFLAEPRTLDDIVEHRFVYRPGDAVGFADPVERRSMQQHLDRLERTGGVERLEGGAYRASP